MKSFTLLAGAGLLLVVLLSGCGGAAGIGGSQVAEGGLGGSGITMGRVNSFDPLNVNGVDFDTTNSDFVYEEELAAEPGDDSGLKVGMVVRVSGTYGGSLGVADIVEYAKLLEGVITLNSIEPNGTGSLEAMGQLITVNRDTVYYDGDETLDIPLHTLPVGAVIEVSGFSDGTSNILATRIDLKSLSHDSETLLEIKGVIGAIDDVAGTLQIGGLSIAYGDNLPDDFAVGVYVEIKGHLIDGILEAVSLELEGDGDLSVAGDGEWVELEGIVTEVISADGTVTLFKVNAQQVLADASTDYNPGRNADDIVINQPLKVAGLMQGDTLLASSIEVKVSPGEQQKLIATLEQIDKESGLLDLLGQTVKLARSTIFEEEINPRFNLAKVEAGDLLEVNVRLDQEMNLIATKLKRKPQLSAGEAQIQGMVQEINLAEETIKVLNITVYVPGLSELVLAIGDRVEVSGTFDGTRLLIDNLSATQGNGKQGNPPGLEQNNPPGLNK